MTRARLTVLLHLLFCSPLALAADPPVERREDAIKTLDAVRTWADFQRVAHLLNHPDFHVQDAAAWAVFRVWKDPNTKPPVGLSDQTRADIIRAMKELAINVSVPNRDAAHTLIDYLGGDWRERKDPRTVITALADDRPDVRASVAKQAENLFRPGQADPDVIASVVDAMCAGDSSANLIAVGLSWIDRMGPAARAIATDIAVARLTAGQTTARALLDKLPADKPGRVMAVAAAAVATEPRSEDEKRQLVGLLETIAFRPTEAQAAAAGLLQKSEPLRLATARLVMILPHRFDRRLLIADALAAGAPQSRAVLDVLAIDSAGVTAIVASMLKAESSATRLATLETLQHAQLTLRSEPALLRQLESLLTDPDDPVRFAAARLLDRKDILNRARLPGLLADLRGDQPTRRQLAARQVQELDLEPRELTTALIRATDRGDYAARTGLVDALHAANATRTSALQVLRAAAADDGRASPESRACARAALREVAAAAARP